MYGFHRGVSGRKRRPGWWCGTCLGALVQAELLVMLAVLTGAGYSGAANAIYWGAAQADQCRVRDYRQWSARLWDIPFLQDWDQACRTTPGLDGRVPDRCVNLGVGGEWGEWDRYDSACPYWGSYADNGCTAPGSGLRKYSSRLWDIPTTQGWNTACQQEAGSPNGIPARVPDRCIDLGVGGEWGEWDVSDNSCGPFAQAVTAGSCYALYSHARNQFLRHAFPNWMADSNGLGDATAFRLLAAGAGDYFIQNNDGWFLSYQPLVPGAVGGAQSTLAGEVWRFAPGTGTGQFSIRSQGDAGHGYLSADAVLGGITSLKGSASSWEQWSFVALPDSACRQFEPQVNASGVTVPTFDHGQPVWGIADVHAHPFAQLGFGGELFQGDTHDANGAQTALQWCAVDHGPGGALDFIGHALTGTVGHLVGGFPQFDGWPRWNAMNHQQVYWRWLRRAHLAGLRLMVALAVSNEVLCQHAGHVRSCDDMLTVDQQLAAAYDLEQYVAAHDGGWLAIAETPAEARQIIESGKLALVLGIEVDSLFGCKLGQAGCDAQQIETALDSWYAKGARHIFPVHVFDNQFAGAALYHGTLFNVGNKLVTGDWFDARECSAEGYGYQEPQAIDAVWAGIFGAVGLPTHAPAGAHCNVRGLSPTGRLLIEQMMRRGLVIDVDHMSRAALDDTLGLVESRDYPVVSGHTGFTELSIGQKNSEAQKTPDQLCRIKRLGGLVAPILQQGRAGSAQNSDDGTRTYRRSPVPRTLDDCGRCADPGGCGLLDPAGAEVVGNTCSYSSRSFAQAYLYAVDAMRPAAGATGALHAVPFGSDFNGLIQTPAPRFGTAEDACGDDQPLAAQGAQLAYPVAAYGRPGSFDRQQSGLMQFDYNSQGFAHVGMLPDFIGDLKLIGVSDADLAPLFNSAEAYIRLWERAAAKADRDNDGLADGVETGTGNFLSADDTGTDPTKPDTDGDGLLDGFEVAYGYNPNVADDTSLDLDGDGLDVLAEQAAGTDPNLYDTDGDGFGDGAEWLDPLADPLDPTRSLASGDINENFVIEAGDLFLALRILFGELSPTAQQMMRADVAPVVDGVSRPDGVVNEADVLNIYQKAIGMPGAAGP